MAKLYRGVRGIPHRYLTAAGRGPAAIAFCALVWTAAAPAALGQDAQTSGKGGGPGTDRSLQAEAVLPTGVEAEVEAEIERHIEGLVRGDERARKQAYGFIERAGLHALPALLELRGHSSPSVRRWANRGVRLLKMGEPAKATALADSHLVSKVILAYSDPLDFKALPVIKRFLNDERMEVREAARQAMGRFGRNAIWQLREACLEATGKYADNSWAPDRVALELYAALDRPAIEQAGELLTRGLSAFVSGKLQTMKQCFDRALVIHPELERAPEMAPGYAALGAGLLEKDDLEGAAAAYSRALRLAPRSAKARTWRGQLAFIRSEQRLRGGVADLEGYQEALQLDPGNQAAATVVDRLGGAWLERLRAKKRAARFGAVVLLGLFALLLLAPRAKGSSAKTRDAA
jgi:hypothetical protein